MGYSTDCLDCCQITTDARVQRPMNNVEDDALLPDQAYV